MKVLHLVHNFYGFSGASKQAKSIATGIAEYYPDIQQRFFTLEPECQNISNMQKYEFFVYLTNKRVLNRIFNLIKVIIKYRPAIAHFHGADFALLVVCKLLGVKVYWKTTLYGSDDFKTLTTGRFGFIKKWLIKLIDINNTLTMQIFNVNRGFLPVKKLITIPNAVSIPDEHSVQNKQKLVVIVSALIPRKSVFEGILFFNAHLKNLGYKLYVIGPDTENLDGFSAGYVANCKSLANEQVVFLGELSHLQTLDILKNAKFLIHLSRSEGMPNVVLEAMAYCGYPIVSNMNGLAQELIVDGVTGFNIDSSNDFSCLDTLLLNKDGRLDVINNNGFERVCLKTVDVYLALNKVF